MFNLDLQNRKPIYEQLKNKISELIMLGDLKPDDQLPSVRNFARDLGVNPNTVQKAYQDLERDGIIYSVVGRGSYISADQNLNTQLYKVQLQKLTLAANQAKQIGISEDDAIGTVRQIYKEDESI